MNDDSQSSSRSSARSKPQNERRIAYLFGTTFVVVILLIAIFVPEPSPFQRYVFRIVLGLAAAGVAATISGFLQVQVSSGIRAGGAIAVFIIVYFFSPTQLITTTDTGSSDPDEETEPDTMVTDEWAPAAVSEDDAITCRAVQPDELVVHHNHGDDYFAVLSAGTPIAASPSEETAQKMLRLAQRRTHHCVIGPDTDTPVTYWYGNADADVPPPSPDRRVSYESQDVHQTVGHAFTISTAEDSLRLSFASQDVAERALALAKEHNQVSFLGYEAFTNERDDCGEWTPCWTMYWR